MTYYLKILFFGFVILITACSVFNKKNDSVACKTVIKDKNFTIPANNSDYKINKVSLSDSLLMINVTYNGKSDKDSFDLIFNEMYAKSMPPIATLYLVQNVIGTKQITRDLCFDISNIKYKGGKVKVKIYGYNETLMYVY